MLTRKERFAVKKLLIVLLTLGCLLSLNYESSPGGDRGKPGKKKEVSAWMQAKTSFSKEILQGLTEANFDKISLNAKALNITSFLEGWAKADQPEYRQQITLFNSANKELIRQAEAKNLYGATLAFNQLTVSCVQCHRIVREAKM
jgi:hypothetical protein